MPNFDPVPDYYPLELVGLGVGVGVGLRLGNQVDFNEGVNNLRYLLIIYGSSKFGTTPVLKTVKIRNVRLWD